MDKRAYPPQVFNVTDVKPLLDASAVVGSRSGSDRWTGRYLGSGNEGRLARNRAIEA